MATKELKMKLITFVLTASWLFSSASALARGGSENPFFNIQAGVDDTRTVPSLAAEAKTFEIIKDESSLNVEGLGDYELRLVVPGPFNDIYVRSSELAKLKLLKQALEANMIWSLWADENDFWAPDHSVHLNYLHFVIRNPKTLEKELIGITDLETLILELR